MRLFNMTRQVKFTIKTIKNYEIEGRDYSDIIRKVKEIIYKLSKENVYDKISFSIDDLQEEKKNE